MLYLYRTNFNLDGEVNDFQEAYDYLTEDNMTVYLKDDSRIPQEVRDAIVFIEWILDECDCGHIDLKTNRLMDEKELEFISSYVSGQNSDGLGEGFEQQDFADAYDEDAFNSDYQEWEYYYNDGLDEYNRLPEREKEEYGYREEYAEEYAKNNWGYEPSESDDSYHTMCSFDWRSNSYTFEFIEEIEE